MMNEVLRAVADAVRAEACNCISPVQAAFNGLAARLEAMAVPVVVPEPEEVAVAADVVVVDAPVFIEDEE